MGRRKNYYKNKRAIKEVSKLAKKSPKTFFILLLVTIFVAAIGVGGYFVYEYVIKPKLENNNDPDVPSEPAIASTDISIEFVYLDTYNTGDCTYIKAGNTDILIDAGAIRSSAGVITEYLNERVTDGKIEYVIATHAHEDHIAGFVGTNSIPGIFDTFKIGTLIEFAGTNSTSKLYDDYCTKRDLAISENRMDSAYTALECWNNENGAQREYTLSEGITLEILYHEFYENKASSENDYSVCCLINQSNKHYLFTGDLEEDGEISLVDNNSLPVCDLFKGGHHGSDTSNKDYLLDVIKPKTVCICCCAGSDEYAQSFPYQATIDRLAKHTDEIYVTTVATNLDNNEYAPLNGTIIYYSDGVTYTVTGTNHSTKLKDTDWFLENRTWPTTSP